MKRYLLSSIAICFAVAVNAQTFITISDTFVGETAGGGLYDDANSAATTTGGSSWVTDDGSQLPSFVDRGGGNMAIQIDKTGGTRENAIRIPSLTQGYFSCDFNFIQDGLDGTTVKDGFTLRLSTDSTLVATAPHSSGFVDRSARGFNLNSWHNVKVFFNAGTEIYNYDTTGLTDTGGIGGLGGVPTGKLDVFIDGNLIQNNQDGSTEALNYAGFVIYRSPDQDLILQFDNFEVNGIPEVANCALISGLVVFVLMFLIRMR